MPISLEFILDHSLLLVFVAYMTLLILSVLNLLLLLVIGRYLRSHLTQHRRLLRDINSLQEYSRGAEAKLGWIMRNQQSSAQHWDSLATS